jgi:hypothetical protein
VHARARERTYAGALARERAHAGARATSTLNPRPLLRAHPHRKGHYGFLLVDYYLIGALTGQITNIPAGTLTYDPVYACPYTLPVLLQGTEGLLVCATDSGSARYTLTILFGRLSLPGGGLVVAGSACPSTVELGPGESVSWAA